MKFTFYLCLLFLLTNYLIAQKGNPSDFPYGGYVDSLKHLAFSENSDFNNFTFNDPHAVFVGAKFNGYATFINTTFNGYANFWGVKFESILDFSNAKFLRDANFKFSSFSEQSSSFVFAKFNGSADFGNSKFGGEADFNNTKFDTIVIFRNATFNGNTLFQKVTFEGFADFSEATFNNDANFSNSKFENETNFHKSVFKRDVYLVESTFKDEIDFRRSNFNSVSTIYLEDIKFPDGKLLLYWEQFKGKDSLRIRLVSPLVDSIKFEYYTRIEIIYHKLRDNFLAQGNESAADEVMYELSWQRDEILDEFWWGVYKSIFGWGYQPWKFLLFAVAPIIIIFAFIWYWFFYTLLVYLSPSIFPKIVDASALKVKLKQFNIRDKIVIKPPVTDFNITLKNANRLTRYWHAIFFSTSVLLGMRFKKDWATVFPDKMVQRKTFIYVVTLEWLLGIGLYITFALLVKGVHFSFIKELLGFQ